MKRLVAALVAVAAIAVVLAGCTAQNSRIAVGTSWEKELQAGSFQNVASLLAEKKTVYYAISLHKQGLLNWRGVLDAPLTSDNRNFDITTEIGELLGKKIEQLFQERGVKLVRLVKFEASSADLVIDMQVAASKTLVGLTGKHIRSAASRWFVYCCNSNKPVAEFYQLATPPVFPVPLPLPTPPLVEWKGSEYYADTLAQILTDRFFNAIQEKAIAHP